MIRVALATVRARVSIPRESGDDPEQASQRRRQLVVFPARAGMIRTLGGAAAEVARIPRESGDDPAFRPHRPWRAPYSPRERG